MITNCEHGFMRLHLHETFFWVVNAFRFIECLTSVTFYCNSRIELTIALIVCGKTRAAAGAAKNPAYPENCNAAYIQGFHSTLPWVEESDKGNAYD